jgi:hypothetical protein
MTEIKHWGDQLCAGVPPFEGARKTILTPAKIFEIEQALHMAKFKPEKRDAVQLAKAPDNWEKGWYVYVTDVTSTIVGSDIPIHRFKPDQEDAARMCLAMCQHGGALYELREDGYWWRYFCD